MIAYLNNNNNVEPNSSLYLQRRLFGSNQKLLDQTRSHRQRKWPFYTYSESYLSHTNQKVKLGILDSKKKVFMSFMGVMIVIFFIFHLYLWIIIIISFSFSTKKQTNPKKRKRNKKDSALIINQNHRNIFCLYFWMVSIFLNLTLKRI